jgi:hypothetical protein
MQYIISKADKRRQGSLVRQLWRFMLLSLRFMKLTRQGGCKQGLRSAAGTTA